MKLHFTACSFFLLFQSARALSCYFCDVGTLYGSCLANVTEKECDTNAGFDRCSSFLTSVTTANGEDATILEKECGFKFICENLDPNRVCSSKNQSYMEKGDVMTNCSFRCCTSDLCNSDELYNQPAPSPPPHFPASFATINGSAVPGMSQNLPSSVTTVPTPQRCAANPVIVPLRMTAMLLASFLIMQAQPFTLQ